MIEMNVPGRGIFQIEYLVCDVNGTLAVDGILIPGLKTALQKIQDRIKVYLITANTHGNQKKINNELGVEAIILEKGNEAIKKKDFMKSLGAEKVIAIGQGSNDAEMLREAAIGICVFSVEGSAIEALTASDIVVNNGLDAISLLQHPMRMVATLRK